MGECTVGWDGIINHSEEIPWVAQGEITLLMECIRKSILCLSKDRRPVSRDRGMRRGQKTSTFYCEPQ